MLSPGDIYTLRYQDYRLPLYSRVEAEFDGVYHSQFQYFFSISAQEHCVYGWKKYRKLFFRNSLLTLPEYKYI